MQKPLPLKSCKIHAIHIITWDFSTIGKQGSLGASRPVIGAYTLGPETPGNVRSPTSRSAAPRAVRNVWPKANKTVQWTVLSDERAAGPAAQLGKPIEPSPLNNLPAKPSNPCADPVKQIQMERKTFLSHRQGPRCVKGRHMSARERRFLASPCAALRLAVYQYRLVMLQELQPVPGHGSVTSARLVAK